MKIGAFFCNVTIDKHLSKVNEIDGYEKWGSSGHDQNRYQEYVDCAVNSFKKWHPDIEVIFINDNNVLEYLNKFGVNLINSPIGQKFHLGLEVMKYFKLDKLIILDVDTITCSRVDEMLDDNESDIMVSLNYNIQEGNEYFLSPYCDVEYEDGSVVKENLNINSGVIAFNNIKALERALHLCIEHPNSLGDQGAINELLWTEGKFSYKILDGPYPASGVVYNVRSKGVYYTEMIYQTAGNPFQSHIYNWYVKDNKLYTPDGKQIKVFHLAEGLHGRPLEKFNELTSIYKTKLFNDDTKTFFNNECNCKQFFE